MCSLGITGERGTEGRSCWILLGSSAQHCREHAAHHVALLPNAYRGLFPKALPKTVTKRQTKEFMKHEIHRTVRAGLEGVMQISENTRYFTDKETDACKGSGRKLLKSQSKAFFTTICFLSGRQSVERAGEIELISMQRLWDTAGMSPTHCCSSVSRGTLTTHTAGTPPRWQEGL